MRRVIAIVTLLLASVLCAGALVLWKIVQGGTCGPSEGGGTCNTTLGQMALAAVGVVLLLTAVWSAVVATRERRRRPR